MGEKDAAVFIFCVLVQILILPGEKICQSKAEEGDGARIQIFFTWIDDDRLACWQCLDVLDEEVEA